MSRILISGTNSGCGKTTVTCAVLAALKARGLEPSALKCGPDYIDPMFHRAVTGVPAYNIDPFFLDGDGLRRRLSGKKLAVLEGAMGYYDGIATRSDASAYTVASETDTPVVLVISAKGAGHSLAAVLEGFARHRANSGIAGVIFNDATQMRYADLKKIAKSAGLSAYGYLPRNESWAFSSRHLGLMTADEIGDLQEKLSALGKQAEQSIDLDGLLALAESAPVLPESLSVAARGERVRLAVARDEAFCSIYEENLDLLRSLGCETVFLSPLKDAALPENIHGIYLPGGYPELYAEALSANKSMRESICAAVKSGCPTIAECGGFLYLHERLDGQDMVGAVSGDAFKTPRLQRFGYVTITANRDNLLCRAGESIRSHEFHYWNSDNLGADFIAKKAGRDTSWQCVHATDTLYAGFPHIYFPANPSFAERFVEALAAAFSTKGAAWRCAACGNRYVNQYSRAAFGTCAVL